MVYIIIYLIGSLIAHILLRKLIIKEIDIEMWHVAKFRPKTAIIYLLSWASVFPILFTMILLSLSFEQLEKINKFFEKLKI